MNKTIMVYRNKPLYKEVVDKIPYTPKALKDIQKRYKGVEIKII